MNILIHDFAGHPFQAELSRALAARGHQVTHGWFIGDIGPKGRLERQASDASSLTFQSFGADIAYSKSNFIKRRSGDVQYGKELAAWVEAQRPQIVVCSNTPLDAQQPVLKVCQRLNIPFVYWCQDLFSVAASRLLRKKLPLLGHAIGAYYTALERHQMQAAALVIHITEGFCDVTDRWGITRDRVKVIPNWGALEEIDVRPRENPWADGHALSSGFRCVYSGTLAMKHNPALLTMLADQMGDDDQLVVASAGSAVEALATNASPHMTLMPLQPIDAFPDMLAAADVLLALIEPDAGVFSVPSKVLAYLCAGRPIVLAAPEENLAAQIIQATSAGTVVSPTDLDAFAKAALAYKTDKAAARQAGEAGRAYAEEHFAIDRVCSRFEMAFEGLLS